MARTRPTLADRYRRLLLCYPRRYRRARGAELIDTLLDLAPPGRTHPTAREAANLVRHGLRCQLGRPASRAVVVWATLTTVVCALFAAAVGSWIGWQTARPLPGQAEAAQLFTEVLGRRQSPTDVHVSPALFVIYEQPLRWRSIDTLLSFDGGEYQRGAASIGLQGTAGVSHEDTLRSVRERLRARGWRVSGTTIRTDCAGCDPSAASRRAIFTARRGDEVLEFEIYLGGPRPPAKPGVVDDDIATYLYVGLVRATPWAAYPIGAAGGLLGAAAGWWLCGWVSRHTENRRHPLRVATTFLGGLTLLLWWLPIALAFPSMLKHHSDETHFSWHPMWEWLGQPAGSPLFITGATTALLALGLASLPRRRSAEVATVDAPGDPRIQA